MADSASFTMRVEVHGKKAQVQFARPLTLSGDRRKHRKQLKDLADDVIEGVLTALGGQFTDQV